MKPKLPIKAPLGRIVPRAIAVRVFLIADTACGRPRHAVGVVDVHTIINSIAQNIAVACHLIVGIVIEAEQGVVGTVQKAEAAVGVNIG
ncbi:hypothetical protein Amal_03997 [Acetobacter malorum]|uniref:Uncharacterized protein n=1 Tax=Acetobacter malorum TaxID=178901 RepID=A0A177FZ96_9PROT|nr:hypothetical protein Amal_03997 [Acetobacter malorum]